MSFLSDLINLNLTDSTDKIIAEYVWIGGSGLDLRSKARTLPGPVTDPAKLPKWNYDGSSTNQAPGDDSEVILYPQAIFKDPFRRGNNILARLLLSIDVFLNTIYAFGTLGLPDDLELVRLGKDCIRRTWAHGGGVMSCEITKSCNRRWPRPLVASFEANWIASWMGRAVEFRWAPGLQRLPVFSGARQFKPGCDRVVVALFRLYRGYWHANYL
ncbi:hypothetical protein SDJN02_12119 [Cucurbita argyrosperma subsp. argyrosperma]|nr:hypothetical protein SDJN02_12119 [Cucurbita argyrosperma subsp. argyrosperma]